jgi:phosphopantetheine adenylyltransferase
MKDETKFKRVADDAPNRCQAITAKGQCNMEAVENGTYCIVHGGHKQLIAEEKAVLANYMLSKWQSRIDDKKKSPDIKSLRDEIAILRMFLEEKLNRITDAFDFTTQAGSVSEMIMKIEKVVTSCHRLEEKTGQVIDKSTLMMLASRIVDIIKDEVEDSKVVQSISLKIMELLVNEKLELLDEN